MLTYEQLLEELFSHADEKFRAFHKSLLKNDAIQTIGVRTPVLRAIAKREKDNFQDLLAFPDAYYEVTFIKCACACFLPYEALCACLDELVSLLDNWATCDSFAPACIAKNRDTFLVFVDKYLADGRLFARRFALTTMLHFYVDETYLPAVLERLARVDAKEYYVSTAAAWLAAEVAVRSFAEGVAFFQSGALDRETRRRAIRKACESRRLSARQKALLRGLGRGCHSEG